VVGRKILDNKKAAAETFGLLLLLYLFLEIKDKDVGVSRIPALGLAALGSPNRAGSGVRNGNPGNLEPLLVLESVRVPIFLHPAQEYRQ
jgi:hypothetical protein